MDLLKIRSIQEKDDNPKIENLFDESQVDCNNKPTTISLIVIFIKKLFLTITSKLAIISYLFVYLLN